MPPNRSAPKPDPWEVLSGTGKFALAGTGKEVLLQRWPPPPALRPGLSSAATGGIEVASSAGAPFPLAVSNQLQQQSSARPYVAPNDNGSQSSRPASESATDVNSSRRKSPHAVDGVSSARGPPRFVRPPNVPPLSSLAVLTTAASAAAADAPPPAQPGGAPVVRTGGFN